MENKNLGKTIDIQFPLGRTALHEDIPNIKKDLFCSFLNHIGNTNGTYLTERSHGYCGQHEHY